MIPSTSAYAERKRQSVYVTKPPAYMAPQPDKLDTSEPGFYLAVRDFLRYLATFRMLPESSMMAMVQAVSQAFQCPIGQVERCP